MDNDAYKAQLAQSQKMQAIGQLAGGVAHDFNNILTAMMGYCDLLLMHHKPGDKSFPDIMQIKQNGNRAAMLIRQLLAFSRQQTLQPKVLKVPDIVTDLSNMLRRLIGENIKLSINCDSETGLVRADQNQLEGAIINLVINARDAMMGKSSGALKISVCKKISPGIKKDLEDMPPGEYALVEVSDTGIGIPEENLQRIFDPFFTTKEVGSGTGLGLSTVYGIVKQTEGFIFVDSEIGKGTKFSIYLPVYQGSEVEEPIQDVDHSEQHVQPQTAQDPLERAVLLVEDDEAVRSFATRALKSRGFKVIEACNGVEALEIFKEHQHDIELIVSDVVMPEMDGPALASQIRAFKPDVKVLLMSGYAEDGIRQTLKEIDLYHFLPKPFSLKQMITKVSEMFPSA